MLRSTFRRAVPAALLGAFLVMGCGESDQEAAFRDATDALNEAREVAEDARARVQEHEQVVSEAQAELAEALGELEEAENALADARERVGLHATDDVLFRTVQTKLLQDRALEGVAIAARVEKGVVVLSGAVPDGGLRDRAGELARSVPGVADVDNRIQVDVSAPPPE